MLNSNTKKYFVLIVLFVFPVFIYLFFASGKNNFALLPILSEDINEISAINPDHILGEATPSAILKLHFKNALDIILESQTMSGSRDLNIDEVMMDTSDMSRDEIVEYLKEKFHDENQRLAHHDSASSNVIHLYPPSDKLH